MRTGPKPLPFQLSMASMAAAGLAGGTNFPPDMLQDFFSGIQKYQSHEYKRMPPNWPVSWQCGEARLLQARASNVKVHKTPIILVPSMINKSDILDIAPDRSMLRWLAGQGFDTYLLDWGTPTEDDGQGSIDDVIMQRLIPAVESVGGPSIVMGYCMGGVLCAALSCLRPDLVRGLMLLAAPWNFHDDAGALKARLEIAKPMAQSYLKQYGRLPESWMQAVFATLDPESAIKKFAHFSNMPEKDARADLFVAVEDWLNDGVDLPAAIAHTCIEEWYGQNLPYAGTWQVSGKPIRAQDIKAPTFIVAASDDKIVPAQSAMAFADQRLKSDRLICSTGHIGLIAGSKVVEQVWTPASHWFAAQQ